MSGLKKCTGYLGLCKNPLQDINGLLPLNEFCKDKRNKNGFGAKCKKCFNSMAKERYKKNPENKRLYGRSYSKNYRKNNPEKIHLFNIEYRKNNLEKEKKRFKKYYDENKQKLINNQKIYKEKNKDKVKEYWKNFRKKNPEKLKKQYKIWASKNKEKVFFNTTKRRIGKLKRTPPWVNNEIKKDIKFLYKIRSEMQTPENWHIDHIIPLQGKLVSGLHVPWNLQLLEKSKNKSKYNKFEPLIINFPYEKGLSEEQIRQKNSYNSLHIEEFIHGNHI